MAIRSRGEQWDAGYPREMPHLPAPAPHRRRSQKPLRQTEPDAVREPKRSWIWRHVPLARGMPPQHELGRSQGNLALRRRYEGPPRDALERCRPRPESVRSDRNRETWLPPVQGPASAEMASVRGRGGLMPAAIAYSGHSIRGE